MTGEALGLRDLADVAAALVTATTLVVPLVVTDPTSAVGSLSAVLG